MKKSLSLLVLLCYFSVTTYSSNINSDLNIINLSEINFLIESKNSKSNLTSIKSINTDDLRPKYRIGFNAPQIDHRQILLTIDENTTDGFDWGYDAQIFQMFNDDMYWVLDDKKYVIQATNSITIGKEIALGIITVEGGAITIGVDAIENPIEGIKVCLKDKELNLIYEIQETDYQITLPAGEYLDRYTIIFMSSEHNLNEEIIVKGDTNYSNNEGNHLTFNEDNVVSTVDENMTLKHHFLMYVTNGSNTLNIKNNQFIKINNLILYNRLGQITQIWDKNLNSDKLFLPINAKQGIYIIQATTERGTISKRIII